MRNESETREKVIEFQVALDKAILDKQNAETEAAMVKEKAESCKAEIKRLELMVCSFNRIQIKVHVFFSSITIMI